MSNPYESPRSLPAGEESSRRFISDIGRFVGHYLMVVACLSVASMLLIWLLFGKFTLDFNVVLYLWAGSCLKRHNRTARKWVIAISGLFVLICLVILLVALFFGTEGLVKFNGEPVKNPPLIYVFGGLSFLLLLGAVPFGLLLTQQARAEFRPKEK